METLGGEREDTDQDSTNTRSSTRLGLTHLNTLVAPLCNEAFFFAFLKKNPPPGSIIHPRGGLRKISCCPEKMEDVVIKNDTYKQPPLQQYLQVGMFWTSNCESRSTRPPLSPNCVQRTRWRSPTRKTRATLVGCKNAVNSSETQSDVSDKAVHKLSRHRNFPAEHFSASVANTTKHATGSTSNNDKNMPPVEPCPGSIPVPGMDSSLPLAARQEFVQCVKYLHRKVQVKFEDTWYCASYRLRPWKRTLLFHHPVAGMLARSKSWKGAANC